jgi:glycosyltransferase involved in cell wall biosynthesis
VKVCLAATTFPRFAGDGQGAFIWELARAVRRHGVAVHVVALHSPGAKVQETIEEIEVTRPRYWWPEGAESLRKDGGGLPMTLRKYPLARLQLPFFLARYSAAIAQVARHCDLVHAHWTLSGGAALLGQVAHRKPLLVTVHGSDIFQVPRHPIGAPLTRAILNRVDRVTAVSHALKEATSALGIDPEKIEVISNGIDLTRFAPPSPDPRHEIGEAGAEQPKIILFAGFLIKRKGVRYLIEAMSLLMSSLVSLLPEGLPPYRLVIAGEGPEEDALRQQVAALGVADRVEFVGFQPQSAIAEWMRRARVFVLPSLEEGQGVVLLEALASGTPVIASDVDGMREVVAPEVGLRVPPADPPALTDALRQLLTEDDAWRRMSEAARQRAVTLYDWDKIGAQFVEVYRRVAAQI